MENHNRCLGCMEIKGSEPKCPNCGWVEGSVAASALHLPPGTILHDKYLLGRVLGQGGFGITYLAWDLNLNLKLAIKEYFPQEMASRATGKTQVSIHSGTMSSQYQYGMDKFLDEARMLARFEDHPNIVSVRDYFQANSTAYLVMSYIEGVTLKELMASHDNKLPVSKAIGIMMPVMDALKELHALDILHRDISPDNIYINKKGQVVLIDFGAARQAISEQGRVLSVIIKPGYAPEEQYRSKGVQGPWTDIYSLAATTYHMITGVLPPESLDRLVDDTLVPPSQLGLPITPEQEWALLKALAVQAKDRFQNVSELQDLFLGRVQMPSINLSDQVKPDAIPPIPADSQKPPVLPQTPPPFPVNQQSQDMLESNKEHLAKNELSLGQTDDSNEPRIRTDRTASRPNTAIYLIIIFIVLVIGTPLYNNVLNQQTEAVVDEPVTKEGIALYNNVLNQQTEAVVNFTGNTAGNIINAGYAAYADNCIYYHNDIDGGKVYKICSDSNPGIRLSNYSAWSINVYDDRVYYSNKERGYRIYSVRIDGSEEIRINNDYSSNINIADDWIYYRNWDDGESIYKVRLDGSDRTKINSDSSWHINVSNGWLFYRNRDEGNRIFRVNLNGSERTFLNEDRSWFINVVGDWIYYCNEDDGWRTYKIKTDGSNRTKVNDDYSGYLNVLGDTIYYVNRQDNDNIYSINIDGNNRIKINNDASCCLNIVGDWIYYKNLDDYEKIYRVRIDGSERQVVH
jgi:serine/threonine protein kinase